MVAGDTRQYACQCTDSQRVMLRNGHMMLNRRIAGESCMTSGLARDLVSKTLQPLDELRSGDVSG